MDHRGLLGLGGVLIAAGFVANCVGDESNTNGNSTDAGAESAGGGNDSGATSDGSTAVDSGTTDAGTDSGAVSSDGGPTCVITDAGTPGTLDPSFSNGLKKFPIPPDATHTFDTETAAIDQNGRIYVIGRAQNCVSASSSFDVAVIRLAKNGDFDATFGTNGYVCFDFGGAGDSAIASYVDASNRLVFAGQAGASKKAFVGRMLQTGALDPAFNGGSVLEYAPETPTLNYNAYGATPDGTGILLSGGDNSPFGPSTKGWVARVTDTGTIDTATFTPYLTTAVAGFRAGHVKIGGKIYLVGESSTTSDWTMVILDGNGLPAGAPTSVTIPNATSSTTPGGTVVQSAAGMDDQVFVAGALGTNPSQAAAKWFTTGGGATASNAAFDAYWDPAYNRGPVAVQCDGKVIVGAGTIANPRRPLLARYAMRDGSRDMAWGTTGLATLDSFDAGSPGPNLLGVALAERADGRLVVVTGTDGLDGAWVFQVMP
jgi:uncharacterized delta-60 repeat protein